MKKLFYFLLSLILIIPLLSIPLSLTMEINGNREIIIIPDMDIVLDENNELILSKWDKEATLTIKSNYLPFYKRVENNTVELKYFPYDVNIYEVENGLEYEVVFNEKPRNNVVEIPIDLNGLVYYYQPPLTEELNLTEFDLVTETEAFINNTRMIYRPENVIGSYAFFGSKQWNKYTTGKAFHLYRPLIYDANNDTEWGILNIENNLITITISKQFLNKATYPVTVDPTFGKTDIGATEYVAMTGRIRGSRYTASESGTTSQISVYMRKTNAGEILATTGLYDVDGSNDPNNQVGLSSETGQIDNTYKWYNFTIVESFTSGEYYIFMESSNHAYVMGDATGERHWSVTRTYGDAWDDPFISSGSSAIEYSEYVTYEPIAEINYTVTFLKDFLSTFLVNGTDTANNTQTSYLNQTVLNLDAIVYSPMEFSNFDIDDGNYTIITKPYNWTISENQTITLNIELSTTTRTFPLNDFVLITDMFIIGLALIGFFIPLGSWISVILAVVCLIPLPNLTGSNVNFVRNFTVGTLTLSVITALLNIARRFKE